MDERPCIEQRCESDTEMSAPSWSDATPSSAPSCETPSAKTSVRPGERAEQREQRNGANPCCHRRAAGAQWRKTRQLDAQNASVLRVRASFRGKARATPRHFRTEIRKIASTLH